MKKENYKTKVTKLYNKWLKMRVYKKILIFLYFIFLVSVIIILANSLKYHIREKDIPKIIPPEIKRKELRKKTLTHFADNEYLVAENEYAKLLYDFEKDNIIYKTSDGTYETNPYKMLAKKEGKDKDEYFDVNKKDNPSLISTFGFDIKYSSDLGGKTIECYSSDAVGKEYFKPLNKKGIIINYQFESSIDRSYFPYYINVSVRNEVIRKIENYFKDRPEELKAYLAFFERSYITKDEEIRKNTVYSFDNYKKNYNDVYYFIWYGIYGLTDEKLKEFNSGKRIMKYKFNIPIMYELVANRLKTTVLTNEIKEYSVEVDGAKWILTKIAPNKNLLNTVIPNKAKYLIPDGSGAIIESDSLVYWRGDLYENKKYLENADERKDASVVKMPVMFLSEENKDENISNLSMLYIDNAALQSAFKIDTSKAKYRKMFAEFDYRIIGNSSFIGGEERLGVSKEYNDTHFSVEYSFAKKDNSNGYSYYEMAKFFQNTYLDKYFLPIKKEADIGLEFLGSFMRKEFFIGIPKHIQIPLTNISEVNEIKEELKDISKTSFYLNWQENCLYSQIPTTMIKPYKNIGDFNKLDNTYLITNFVKTFNDNYKNFANKKNGMRTIKNHLKDNYELDIITNSYKEEKENRYYLLSPKYLKYVIDDYNYKNPKRPIAISDIANLPTVELSNEDYSPSIVEQIKKESLNKFKANIAIKEPYYNMLVKGSIIYDVKPSSSEKPIIKASVPFYETVLSKYFKTFLTSSNVLSKYEDRYYLLYSLLSGANIKYTISANETNLTKDTKYTKYHSVYYDNYKDLMIKNYEEMNNFYNTYGTSIYNAEVIDYNIFYVVFEKGEIKTKLLFNLNGFPYFDKEKGIEIDKYSYKVIK